jgi:hypothetical protein
MKAVCDVCWRKIVKPIANNFEPVEITDNVFIAKLSALNTPGDNSFHQFKCFSENDWEQVFIGKDAWQPNISPIDQKGDISSPDKISLIKSHYATPWFDVPFNCDQSYKLEFSFPRGNIEPFQVQIQDENYNVLLKNNCVAKEQKWIWNFNIKRPHEKMRFVLFGDDFFTIKLPNAVNLYSASKPVDFLKYRSTKVERDRFRDERDQLEGERDRFRDERNQLEGERDRFRDERNHLLASYSYRLGRFITWLPRKLLGFLRCLKNHGLFY